VLLHGSDAPFGGADGGQRLASAPDGLREGIAHGNAVAVFGARL
jgi:hypothetical protein